MATGLEALGAASAVISLISFAGSLVSLTMKIYDGIPTAENELEDYATRMLDAAKRVKSRQVTRGTPANDKLSEVSQRCIDAATELENATRKIATQKGSRLKAFYSAVRAKKNRAKISELNKSLNLCKGLMETEILLKICDQDSAVARQQSQGFRSLEVDVQNLILKIAEGYTRVEQLVSIEAQATRDAINTHVTSELKALGIKNISDNQRERLLKSLKPEEIRERYNAVLPSSDACFERVFASYERVCRKDPGYKALKGHEQAFGDDRKNSSEKDSVEERAKEEVDEIDLIWEYFSTWLQSDDKLFWIRGKPGSGKSTLIKFVINNDNTKRLLGSWHLNTRILSHFFWKIGSEPQNSIRGLLCSLLYDLLLEDDEAIEKVLREFKFSESKDFYKEWSSPEAEKILWYLLDASAHPTCIFVDGLDEISDKDGYQALLSVVQRLTTCRGVKICVSSRPETELLRKFKDIGVQNLRLDDLTKPEMAFYLQKEYKKLPKEQCAHLPLQKFTETLLGKAQGVFLWLALASKSVTNGILNGDDQELISKRLEELPEELESLYQRMWERLNGQNQIYRETAARYFRFVVADGWATLLRRDGLITPSYEPTLVQLSLAVKAEDRLIYPPKASELKLSELNTMCAAIESDIQTRCAGMLQVRQDSSLEDKNLPDAIYPLTRPVQFIHRTAHDFLVDTEYGQLILNYRSNETTLVDEGLKLLKCRLNLANTYYRKFKVASACVYAFVDLNRLNEKGANPEAILEILRTIKDLHEDGALIVLGVAGQTLSFACEAAYYLVSFDDFIISSFMPTPSPELATNSLQALALVCGHMIMSETSARIIGRMVELGGDAHVANRSNLTFELPGHDTDIARYSTAFESLLCGALERPRRDYKAIRLLLEAIEILVQTCPDLHRRVMLFLPERGHLPPHRLLWVGERVAVEVDLQFLICWLLDSADLGNSPDEFYKTRELVASFTRPHVRFRLIACRREDDHRTHCYRILDQEPYLDIIGSIGHDNSLYRAVKKAFEDVRDAMNGPIDNPASSESSFLSGSFQEHDGEDRGDHHNDGGTGHGQILVEGKRLQKRYEGGSQSLEYPEVEHMNSQADKMMGKPARMLIAQAGLDRSTTTSFSLLDHGCGTGLIASCPQEAIQPSVLSQSRIVCADVNARFVDILLQRARRDQWINVDATVLDAQETGLSKHSFSHVTMNFAMHIIPDPTAVLRDTRRILRPGGLVAFSVPHANNGHGGGWVPDLRSALESLPFQTSFPDPMPVALHGKQEWVEPQGIEA
ncbi:hypothetical protein FMEXI_7209 [Fusarium mexicanum]|uniref:NACHT domain-containing protein n=1 Tax=Fusarium mexicanum TaxID=751941 RepID=A0A8H5ITS1_9HYPO|nr:hypothetical protein FMEXI_7209 [Fusarium mexicanum]